MEGINSQPSVRLTDQEQKPDLLKDFSKKSMTKKNYKNVVIAFVVVLAGVATGWFMSGNKSESAKAPEGAAVQINQNEAGVADEATFRDNAEGVLVKGGIKGEGTHHLDRGTGETKYVYLTSTVIDLDKFDGKKVTVWGETISAKNAGWLMDVGKIKVVN